MATKKQIGSIWGIGRNYKDHAKEMGEATPSEPIVFLKSSACVTTGHEIQLPSFSKNVHHELELGLLLGDNLIPSHLCLVLDLTARDIQADLKSRSLPWALSKSFIGACPIGPWVKYKGEDWFQGLQFHLKNGNQVLQAGSPKSMIFQPPPLIEFLKSRVPLSPGDFILTGTPEGVGPLQKGDKLNAEISGICQHHWSVI